MATQGKDDKGKTGGDDDLAKKLESIVGVVDTLAKSQANLQKSVQESLGALSTSIKDLAERGAGKQGSADDADEDDLLADADLENLSRKDFLSVIMGNMDKMLKNFGKSVEDKVTNVSSRLDNKDIELEFKEVTAKYKDFTEWGPEIKKLINESPGLSLERAYKLARQEFPDKAKEVDEKFKDPNDGKDKKSTGFGGLTPTSGRSTDKPTDMDPKDAAEAAWDETMADMDLEGNG